MKKYLFIALLVFNLLILPAFAQDSGGNGGNNGGSLTTPSPSTPIWENPSEDPCYLIHPPDQSANGGGVFSDAANMLASILPATPDYLRIPTILNNLGGQGSLAGNFAYEMYTAAWQYFAIIAFIKFYQMIPGKLS